MRKVITTLGAGPQRELLDLALPSFEAYADRHGYEVDARTEVPVRDRPASWSKIAIIREHLRDADAVVWLDADALVVDSTVDILEQLRPDAFLGVVEHVFWGNQTPNAGVIALRAGPLAERFLEEVWEDVRFIDHPWWENAAVVNALVYSTPPWSPRLNLRWHLQNLVRDHLGRHIFTVRPRRASAYRDATTFLDVAWNSTPMNPAPRPRIVHYAGLDLAERKRRMRADVSGLGASP